MSTKNKIDKNHLISVIEDIILDEGISGLSIRKVASKANISIGGVQYAFGNKEGMIKAVAYKNEDDYNQQIDILSKNDNSKYSKLKAHINYIANCNSTEEFSKMSRMVTMLLQDEIILKEFQDWYTTSLDSIDTSNDEGKKLRLAFLLSEALFALLSFKYIKLSDKEQKEIFEDLKNFYFKFFLIHFQTQYDCIEIYIGKFYEKRLINFKFIMTIAIIEILCYMAVDMYLASMTDISEYFGTSYSKVQLSLTFYLFAMGIGQLFFGPIIDFFGRKIPLILGISLYALCSFAITTSSNIELFLLYRVVQGLGVALIYVCLISMVRDVSKGKVAAKIFAILITIGAITPILAPAIGGYIDQVFGWKAVFYLYFILAILVVVLSLFTLQETLKKEKKVTIDFKNIFIIYSNIIKNNNFLIPAIATCLMYMFVFGYIAGASYSYKEIYNLDSKTFGLVFGATGSALLFGALLSTKLLEVLNMKQLSISGSAIIIFGSIISFISSNIDMIGLDGIVIGFFISFFGLGLAEASLFSIAMSSQKTSLGSTAALLGSLQLLLPATSTLVAGYLVETSIFYWLGFLFILSILSFIFTMIVFKNSKILSV